MVLSGQAGPDAEEWACPRCGRRMLLRWPPQFEKLVLEPGDTTAVHVGAKGGVRAGGITAARLPADEDQRWLRENGIDWNGTTA